LQPGEPHENVARVVTGLNRLRTALNAAETEYQLRLAGLTEFLDLTNHPNELITQLYLKKSNFAFHNKGNPLN
jgi:hypothetical protein